MKIKKITTHRFKLLKLQLIKAKIYKNFGKSHSIEQVEILLKKVLKIIFHYHLNNKRIFFVGVPHVAELFFSNALKTTKHLFLTKSLWVNGILSNKASIYRYLKSKQIESVKKKDFKNKDFKILFSIKKKPDLIVIFNRKAEKAAIQESYKLRTPTIILDSTFQDNSLYKILGNFNFLNKKSNNVFLLLLNSIFKRSE